MSIQWSQLLNQFEALYFVPLGVVVIVLAVGVAILFTWYQRRKRIAARPSYCALPPWEWALLLSLFYQTDSTSGRKLPGTVRENADRVINLLERIAAEGNEHAIGLLEDAREAKKKGIYPPINELRLQGVPICIGIIGQHLQDSCYC